MPQNESSTRDDRVNEAIAAYLRAVERGETPDRDTFLAEHADIAQELRSFFGNQSQFRQMVEDVARGFTAVSDQLETTAKYNAPADESPIDSALAAAGKSPAVQLPERIGRYRIERVLGKGGFGLVYLAQDDQLSRPVAIKVPHRKLVDRLEDAEAYLTEARTVANLDHPHIVPVFDVGSTEQFPCYVVSKYIDGMDLATRLKQSRLSIHETVELVATVAEALHHAHKQGLVHRDVKPSNILLDKSGKPFVADFGLALREQDVGSGSRYAGTPAYMSPEQARGEGHRVDGRSDIFSLGVVLYELLIGRRPFREESPARLMEQVMSFEPRPPRQYNDDIPRELDRICLKVLSKRASERYSTAKDMADDLRHFLTQQPSPLTASSGSPLMTPVLQPPTTLGASGTSITPATPNSDSQPVKIVPKGLRSFDEHDADFFLELLPGPRDRDGLPDSLRFWKTRIEETDADKTFSVGLIYGPSGCGKSSLVKAGLLPRLADNVLAVYVEATGEETETRLRNWLRKLCPALPDKFSLKETLAALRRGQWIPVGKKVLIVLDQFEQWLHARKEEHDAELIQALRQCDGGRVQCVVMVRDDFWLAVSRFLRELEIRLIEGHNSALADLFDADHAGKVLAAFGRAFGKLPESSGETSQDQKEFLNQAVSGLAQEGKVISVRLALFAEMMKGKVWTPATLKEVGGTEGVGITFLEETFSVATSPPEHRYHQKAARGVLKALLPESGADIKGHMRSQQELLEASGYGNRPKDFDDLVRILDSEIRLITPTDQEGNSEGERGGGHRFDENWSPQVASPPKAPTTRYYQLTHDYVVHSLRDWLTRKQRETRRGRAELRLCERAAMWHAKPENRHLPSWWEYLAAVWFIPIKSRTVIQQKLLRKAGRVHTLRWGSALAVLLLIGFVIWKVVSSERQSSLQRQVATAVDAVQNNRGLAVPLALRDLQRFPRDTVVAALKARHADTALQHNLGLAYALAAYDEVNVEYLCLQIERAPPEEVDNLVSALGKSQEASIDALVTLSRNAESQADWSLKSRLAVVALHLEDDRIAADMCRIDERPDPIQRTIFIDEFPAWHGDVAKLKMYCQSRSEPGLRSGLCLALGSIPSERLTDPESDAWKPVLTGWYETAPDNATHSSAGWASRQWGLETPPLLTTNQSGESQQRFVNSLGMTLLKMEPGEFVRKKDEQKTGANDETVKLTRAFFLSDREVSVGQFQQFMSDANYADVEKPEKWKGVLHRVSPTADHPVQQVNWYDAVLFCNWLSNKEGKTPCYKRTGKRKRPVANENVKSDAWELVPDANGYRLPTKAEWEYACRAGTMTDFCSGSDAKLLRKYATFTSGTNDGTDACANNMPNGWGLFDMHGNVWEWCNDAVGSLRVYRGGGWDYVASDCRSEYLDRFSPVQRSDLVGFRPALGPSGDEGALETLLSVPTNIPTTVSDSGRERQRRSQSRSSAPALIGD